MKRKPFAALAVGLVIAAWTAGIFSAPSIPQPPGAERDGIEPGIAWYGVLEDGLREAERTGKPILLLSAAPQCAGVSGMW